VGADPVDVVVAGVVRARVGAAEPAGGGAPHPGDVLDLLPFEDRPEVLPRGDEVLRGVHPLLGGRRVHVPRPAQEDRLAQLLDGAGAPPDQLVVLALDDLAGVGPGPGQQEVAVAVGGGLLQGGGEVGLPAAVALHDVEAPPELAFEAGDGLHAGLAGRRGGGGGGVPVPVLAVALAAALL